MNASRDPIPELDNLLKSILITPVGAKHQGCPDGWYAVSDDSGVLAYICHQEDAFAFRLMLANARLNLYDTAQRYRGVNGASLP